MSKPPKISVLIPSTREDDLGRYLKALNEQTFTDYEVIVDKEKGPLSQIRNNLASRARGEIFVFTDDDIVPTTRWLESIVKAFSEDRRIGGVTGPAVIPAQWRTRRDIFRYKWAKRIYDIVFCGRRHALPGHITRAGAWTTGASLATCNYEGEVHFLEACNMAFKARAFRLAGGFDESYGGVGEWCEPDLCFRLREMGYTMHFTPGAKIYHYPSNSGAYVERLKVQSRLDNYELFWRRWCTPNWKLSLYKTFVRLYFEFKGSKRLSHSKTR